MKNLKNNKAITLVALVVTIVLLLILAGMSINFILGQNGIVLKTKEAAEKHERESKIEQRILDEAVEFIDGKNWETAWQGTQVSSNGQLELPIDVTDLSYIYELTIESDLYSGPAILRVYSLNENSYTGKISVNEEGTYGWKLRNIRNDIPVNIENSVTIEFNDNSDSNYGTLTYDQSELGELKITNISKSLKTYSLIGNLILKLENGQDYTVDDFIPFIDYALSKNDLGYSYVNENLTAGDVIEETTEGSIDADDVNNVISSVEFDESLERQLLSYIKTTGYNEMKALEKPIRDQVLSALSGVNVNAASFYTIADYIEENPFLAEGCNRAIGNSIIPFNYIYTKQSILNDLNEDGYIETNTQQAMTGDFNSATSFKNLYSIGNFAGLKCRMYADMYAIAYANYSEENIPLLQDAKDNLDDIYIADLVYWANLYSEYKTNHLNAFYGYLYDNNITINVAGLRIGYYYAILPEISQQFANRGIIFNDAYNPLQDTVYLNEQGITQAMLMELAEAMNSYEDPDEPEGGDEEVECTGNPGGTTHSFFNGYCEYCGEPDEYHEMGHNYRK